MPPAINNLFEKIDSRILRERVLIFITLLAVVFLLWNFLVQANVDRERKVLQAEAEKISSEQKSLETQISTLAMAMASDPAIAKNNEINKLNSEISVVEERLSGLSQGLISAEKLPKVLEEVLLRTASVKLLHVRTLAASELQLAATTTTTTTEANSAGKANSGGTGVYKHGVLIRVAGSYSELIQLMTEIEALQWKFYWESLDYTVRQYPNAEIDIRVFTLSSEEGLLGV
jgi:MSHA biogenesis protein MshJ